MTKSGRGWGAALLMAVAGACSQELSLPEQGRRPVAGAAGAADDGFTGTAGAADDDPTRFGKLPVLDTPSYWPGGAGGEAGEGGSTHDAAHAGRTAAGAATGGSGGTAGKTAASAGDGGDSAEAGAGGAGDAPVGPPRLIFSEYVEGSSTFKALEIYALARSSLEGCELLTYTNGESDGPTRLALHGRLEAGATQVLCTSKLMMDNTIACDRSSVLSFNGDDALALACGDVTLDVIGQIGFDPGSAWGDGATVDHTLRRRCSVEQGRVEGQQPFDPSLEWLPLAVDTFTGLGEHTCTLTP